VKVLIFASCGFSTYWIHFNTVERQHSKITKFLQILGLLNNTLKPNLEQRSTRLKLYKTLALPTRLYGSEIWTLKNNVTKICFESQK
jgi:hypothetical protein